MLFEHLPRKTARGLTILLAASLVIIAALSLVYTFLAPAVVDDICRGGWSKDVRVALEWVPRTYMTWSGRWLTIAIYALTFPHIGITSLNYNIAILLAPVIWFVTFYAFLHIIFRRQLSVRNKAIGAGLMMAIFWVGMPATDQTWYWLTGLVEYDQPFMVMALSLAVLTSSWVTGGKLWPKIGGIALGAVLAFAVPALNEFPALLLSGCLALAIALAAIRKRLDLAAIYFGVLVLVVISLEINYQAPGTAIRGPQDFPNANSLSYGIRSITSPKTSPLGWLGDARMLCLTLLLATTPAFLKLRPEWTSWKLPLPAPFSSMLVVAPIIALGATIAGMFAVSFAQGTRPPGRIEGLMYAGFLVGWVAALAPLGLIAGKDADAPGPLLRAINLAAAVMLPISLLIAPTTIHAVTDLPEVAAKWRPELDARLADIQARVKSGERDLVLQRIAYQPKQFFWTDVSSDPNFWVNQCMAIYYGADTVRAPPEPLPAAPPAPTPST